MSQPTMSEPIMSAPPMQLASSSSSNSDHDLATRKLQIKEAQAQIDDEIKARYLPVCALRTKRNTLSPVSRLPDELLAYVFVLYARQHHRSEWSRVKTYSTSPLRIPSWVRVSYVCGRWRTVALECPSLWTYVFFVSRTWTTVLLQRSMMAPLRVCVDLTYGYRRSVPMLELLLAHLPRIEEFHIRALPADSVSNIVSKLSTSAPLLQSLHISVSTAKRSLGTLDASPERPPLPVVFNGTTPKLRSLELSKLDVAWHMLTLTGVTSLKLQSVPRTNTMKHFSSILSQLPDLAELELVDVLPWKSSQRNDTSVETLVLPRLSRLAIAATIPDVVQFLSHVHVPLNAEVRLKCVYGGQGGLSDLLSYLRKRFNPAEDDMQVSPPLQPIRSLSMDGNPPRTFFTSWSTSEDGYKHRAFSFKELVSTARITAFNHDWDCATPLKLDIKDQFSTAMSEHAMVDILRHLPLAHLQSVAVYIPGGVDLSERFWRDFFSLARGLRFMKIRYTTLRGFVAALSPDHHGWRGQNQVFTAPTLEEIELEQVSFWSACDARRVGDLFACNPTLQCFCDALSRRRHAGHPLKKLTILDSENVGTDEQVDMLRAVVSEVKWDGISIEPDSPLPDLDGDG